MNLINPTALFLAGLAVPIIVFYILKIRLRRVPVSTLMFWQQIFEEKKPRSIWQRLRHLLSLLLQLAFLGLLGLRPGRPDLPLAAGPGAAGRAGGGQLGQHECDATCSPAGSPRPRPRAFV